LESRTSFLRNISLVATLKLSNEHEYLQRISVHRYVLANTNICLKFHESSSSREQCETRSMVQEYERGKSITWDFSKMNSLHTYPS